MFANMSHFPLAAAGLLAIYCALVLFASLAGGWLLLALRLTHARLQDGLAPHDWTPCPRRHPT